MLGHFWIKWRVLFLTFVKWLLISAAVGTVIGAIAVAFAYAMHYATTIREANWWLVFGLPLGGLLIVFLYRRSGQGANTGTNRILSTIRNEENSMPGRVAPLILLSTVITHFFGGSAGREGAALQFGSSLGDWFARKVHLNESDRKILIMSCMSAAFSALFGTPLAAALFPLEVISVGVMYYGALVPCFMSSFVAMHMSVLMGTQELMPAYMITDVPDFYGLSWLQVLALAIICAVAGSLFCIMLHRSHRSLAYYMPNPYVRVAVCGVIIIALRFALQTDMFLGVGEQTIEESFTTVQAPWVFLLKMIFTSLTLSSGYKGGEIVPSLFVGATLGSALSGLLGLPIDLAAACGMVSVFCGVTNSPLSTMLMALELFGGNGMLFYCMAIAVSYLLSGYQSLYIDQKIVYSKTENKYINSHVDKG